MIMHIKPTNKLFDDVQMTDFINLGLYLNATDNYFN